MKESEVDFQQKTVKIECILRLKIYFFKMQTSKKKPAHKSRWKTITVIANDEIMNFQLDEKGKLAPGFKKQKYRKILKYIKMLESNSENPENESILPQNDKNTKTQPGFTLENVFDLNENDMDTFDEFGSFEYIEFLSKK